MNSLPPPDPARRAPDHTGRPDHFDPGLPWWAIVIIIIAVVAVAALMYG